MKQNKFALITAILLGVIALWFYFHNDKGTINTSIRNFAVTEIESIDKIILKKGSTRTVLERQSSGRWMVNATYDVNTTAIKSLLYTIKNIDIKEPVGKNEQSDRIKELLENGVRCEIYQNNVRSKTYYVGNETEGHTGTFMVLIDPETDEPYPKAFVNCIPGVENNLVLTYKAEEREWRDHSVFHYQPEQIVSVKLEVPNDPGQGYELLISGTGYHLKLLAANNLLSGIDTLAIKQYLYYFEQLNFESYASEFADNQIDSIKKTIPLLVLTVLDNSGKMNKVQFYQLPNLTQERNQDGKPLKYDPQHLLAFLGNGKDPVIVKYYEFGKILPPVSYFLRK